MKISYSVFNKKLLKRIFLAILMLPFKTKIIYRWTSFIQNRKKWNKWLLILVPYRTREAIKSQLLHMCNNCCTYCQKWSKNHCHIICVHTTWELTEKGKVLCFGHGRKEKSYYLSWSNGNHSRREWTTMLSRRCHRFLLTQSLLIHYWVKSHSTLSLPAETVAWV